MILDVRELQEQLDQAARDAKHGPANISAGRFMHQDAMADSPMARMAREMAESPMARMAREMAESPMAWMARGMADSPMARMAREMAESPMARMAREMAHSRLFTNELLGVGGILSGASAQAIVGALLANQVAAAAKATGTLDTVAGESFVLDAIAAPDVDNEGIETTGIGALQFFLEQIPSVVRRYLSAVQSAPELAGLMQLIMLILTAAAVYSAQQSASTGDIKDLGKTIEAGTENFKAEAEEIQRRFDQLLADMHQLVASKQQELPPRRLYTARRRTAVKAGQNMRSQTMGYVEAGDKVSIIKIDKKWIEFDFFDYTMGRASKGWAVKKYFERVK
jgi:hypothetical protein